MGWRCRGLGERVRWQLGFHSQPGAVTQHKSAMKEMRHDAAAAAGANEQQITIESHNFSTAAFSEIVWNGILNVCKLLKDSDADSCQIEERVLFKFNTLDEEQLDKLFLDFAVLFRGHYKVNANIATREAQVGAVMHYLMVHTSTADTLMD